MTLHLDTSAVVDIIRDRKHSVRDRYRQALIQREPMFVSSIVAFELWTGAERATRADAELARITKFLERHELVEFGAEASWAASKLKRMLERVGKPIGPYDLLIAAHALSAGATLTTGNVREFSRVPALIVEDWSA